MLFLYMGHMQFTSLLYAQSPKPDRGQSVTQREEDHDFGHRPSYHTDSDVNRWPTNMAIQSELGLLSFGGLGNASYGYPYSCVDRAYLA
jgi:hypothetical protein